MGHRSYFIKYTTPQYCEKILLTIQKYNRKKGIWNSPYELTMITVNIKDMCIMFGNEQGSMRVMKYFTKLGFDIRYYEDDNYKQVFGHDHDRKSYLNLLISEKHLNNASLA